MSIASPSPVLKSAILAGVENAVAASTMFKNLWDHKLLSTQTRARSMQSELGKIENQVEQFLDRIVDADTPSVIAAYETRIKRSS